MEKMASYMPSSLDEPLVPPPSSPSASSSASSTVSSLGEWVCSACSFHNLQKEPCRRCGGHPARPVSASGWVPGTKTASSFASPSSAPNRGKTQHQPYKSAVGRTQQKTGFLSVQSQQQQPSNPASSDHEGSGASSPSSSSGSGRNLPQDLAHLDLAAGPQRRDPRLGPNADEDERRATEEGRKVFVGNLKRPITRNEVVEHFARFGEVERVILNSGFGLVLMATREGALKATAERWQALDWRNVEVFIYQKGAKGASWNRPYAIPPRPGPCAKCGKESAEHCTLCTSSLCLSDNNTCTACCRTCQRSFCIGGPTCGGDKDGLDTCDSCGALTCLFCALRLEATCGQCSRPFSDRLKEAARHRAVKLVNLRIADNDGSVYALVCLLKGDVESSREGQLVAAIDRASKLFDPQASSWCGLTALRAIKELDEAWEATRRVHNPRALRRSAKQWSTDLSALTMPQRHVPATSSLSSSSFVGHHHQPPQQHQVGQFHGHHHPHPRTSPGAGTRFLSSSQPHVVQQPRQQQQQQHVPFSQARKSAYPGEEHLTSTLRSCEAFLCEFEPRPKTDSDWLIANLCNVAFTVTKKKSRFIDELASRMDVWASLLRRIGPETAVAFPVAPSTSSVVPLNKLKRAVVDLDTFNIHCSNKGEFLLYKDAYIVEVIRAARELKRSSPPFTAASLLLHRAGRSVRNVEMRALFVMQGMLPFEACLHHCRYHKCALQVGAVGASCPFAHYAFGVDTDGSQREFELAEYEFSNEPDEISLAVASSSMVQPPPVVSPSPMSSGGAIWGTEPLVANSHTAWGSPAAVVPPSLASTKTTMVRGVQEFIPAPSQTILSSAALDPITAAVARPAYLKSPSTPALGSSAMGSNAWVPHMEPAVKPLAHVEAERHKAMSSWVDAAAAADDLLPIETLIPSGLDEIPLKIAPVAETDIVLQVSGLCDELGLEGPVMLARITAAFYASGAAKHARIWDTDVALLYKELVKISDLPAATRVRMINLITERRGNILAPLPIIGSLSVPPLL